LHPGLVNGGQSGRRRHIDALDLAWARDAGAGIEDTARPSFGNQLDLIGEAGAWPDKAHLTEKDIPQLRQFIELQPPEVPSQFCHRAGGSFMGSDGRSPLSHGPELVAGEHLLPPPDPRLPEDGWAGRVHANKKDKEEDHWHEEQSST